MGKPFPVRTVEETPTGGRPETTKDRVTDLELVERAREGDSDAFGVLVERHHRAALRAAVAALGQTANDADDIVRRVNEGWHMIRTTVPAINAARPRLKDPKIAPPPADAFTLPR